MGQLLRPFLNRCAPILFGALLCLAMPSRAVGQNPAPASTKPASSAQPSPARPKASENSAPGATSTRPVQTGPSQAAVPQIPVPQNADPQRAAPAATAAAIPQAMPAEIEEVVEPESEEVVESESADAEADANFGQAYNSSAMPSPARGNAIRRQAASVQRQLGGRRSGDGFFVSNWFTDSPPGVGGGASDDQMAANFEAPGDCDPLDPSIAEAYIRDSTLREGVSLDLVREIVRRESGFKPCALSPKGAMGMMQLMPDTAVSLGVSDPYDARENIDGGVRLIKRLLDKYNGRPDLALAAYNAGEGSVDSANGIPAFAETREYVAAIMKKVFDTPINRSGRRSPGRRSIPSTGIGASGMAKPTSPASESREIPPIGDAEPLPNTHN